MPMFGNNPFGVRDLSVSSFANEMVRGMQDSKNRQEEREFKKELLKLEQDKLKMEERKETLYNSPLNQDLFAASSMGTRQVKEGMPEPLPPEEFSAGGAVPFVNAQGRSVEGIPVLGKRSGRINTVELGGLVPTAESSAGAAREIETILKELDWFVERGLANSKGMTLLMEMSDKPTPARLQEALPNLPPQFKEHISGLLNKLYMIRSTKTVTDPTDEASIRKALGFPITPKTPITKRMSVSEGGITMDDLKKFTAPKTKGKTIVRTGTMNGKKVIQYSDGSVEYAK